MTDLAHLGELWLRLWGFPLDPRGEHPFTASLVWEKRWSNKFAARVVDEYRRFLYLAVVCQHRVIPSRSIDQAWLLHLTDARSYWDGLCRGVLGQPVYHQPSPRDARTLADLNGDYQMTLGSYLAWFREIPPRDVWPPIYVVGGFSRPLSRSFSGPCL
jgi:hypothetical protein